MKRLIIVLVGIIYFNFFTINLFGQTPQSFSYQAVVRDASGNIVQNQNVSFKFSILENNTTGNSVYVETQQTMTNNLGLVVLAIGNGSVQQGTFSSIQWGSAPHFLKVELDIAGGSNFVEMGTTQLLSVPYALHAQIAENVQTLTAGNGISITGNIIENALPDQIVNITGQGATTVSGSYPNFTISSTDNNTSYSAGNGIDLTGNTITNTLPDLPVNIYGQGATSVSGTYPNFTISSTDNNTTYSAGTGLTLTGTSFSAQNTTALWNANLIQGRSVSSTAPANGQVLGWNGTSWTPATDVNTTYSAGTGLTLTGTTFSHTAHTGDVTGTTSLTVTGIQGKTVSSTAPTSNQVLQYSGTQWTPTQPSSLISAGTGLSYSSNTLNSVWTQNGNNIYNNNAGRVGIGISAPTGKMTIQGDTSNILFEVKDRNGYSVFVVYQDSVQVFVSNSAAKTNKGSFAVNAKAQTKANSLSYLRVAPDSSRIYTQDTLAGFGVRNIGAGNVKTSYMKLTPSNYFIGHLSGVHIAPNQTTGDGLYNCTYGYESGINLISGYSNVLIGYKAGHEQISGWKNVAVGSEAGRFANTTYTTFLGTSSGMYAQGDDNVYIGYNAGRLSANNDNFNSVYIGSETGYNTYGAQNTIVGSGAGSNYTAAPIQRDNNIFIGQGTGLYSAVGGLTNGNICIGNGAGYSSSYYGSDQLFIENSGDVTNPLIHGNFLTNRIAFHRTATTYPLQVGTNNTNGNGAYLTAGGTWTGTSSKSLKDRFEDLNPNDLFSKIENLEVKVWFYKGTQERHIGPFAEDFYQTFGTGVLDEPTYLGKSLAASDVAGVSLAAVKELIKENKQQSDLINQLMQRIEQLEKKVNGTSEPAINPIQNNTR